MLNITDYRDIQEQFNKVIKYSQGLDKVNTDEIFANWFNNKKKIRENYFGNTLIHEIGHVEAHLTEEEIKHEVTKYFMRKFASLVSYDISTYDDFIKYVENNINSFATNILENDYKISEDKVIQKGSKFTKSFKHFITSEALLDKTQLLASEIIQKSKVSGTLCMSIHPMDYISMSENNHNWRSCHALNGEYKLGPLSYMQDQCTIITYIRGDEESVLPRFPDGVRWNSKKWRMCLYLSPDGSYMCAGRQYPLNLTSVIDTIRTEMINMIESYRRNSDSWYYLWAHENDALNQWVPWMNTYLQNYELPDGTEFEFGSQIMTPRGWFKFIDTIVDVTPDDDEALHYNDLLRSTCYTKPFYCYQKWRYSPSDEDNKLIIGNTVKCLRCGEEYVYEDNAICYKCRDEMED